GLILDRAGRPTVRPPMFCHAPAYRHLVGRMLAVYGRPTPTPAGGRACASGGGEAGGIRDGDVFVSNHPYEGGLPHVSDMAFVAPVFADGRIGAFAGSM